MLLDWNLLWHALSNALSNAFKYGDQRRVCVGVHYVAPRLVLLVANSVDAEAQAGLSKALATRTHRRPTRITQPTLLL